ncbi:MAG: hypothetical protein EOP04_32655 [Proteobacteria bacterium]|nr:MAG: hypothetical protein EOP04_32655 [Pseudomonadota bacterium]
MSLQNSCLIILTFLLWAPTGWSQGLNDKPVSLSYLNLIKCFPELKNDQWSMKVDLNQLKEQADKKFVTSQTLLRYRQSTLKDATGHQRRLRLAAKSEKKSKVSYTLTLDKLDARGAGTPVEIPTAQKINPSQKVLDQYFLNQELVGDEYSYFDTKLNGMSMSYKKNLTEIFELEISDPRGKRRVLCEEQGTLGKVCNCYQK